MTEQLYIAVYKKPGSRPYIISTFSHLMDITDDINLHGKHIGLDSEIARAGYALIGTKEDLEKHIITEMQGHHFNMKYMFYVPLFRIPENIEITR